jgi:hypothetical protein
MSAAIAMLPINRAFVRTISSQVCFRSRRSMVCVLMEHKTMRASVAIDTGAQQWRSKHWAVTNKLAGSRRSALCVHQPATDEVAKRPHHQRDRSPMRNVDGWQTLTIDQPIDLAA